MNVSRHSETPASDPSAAAADADETQRTTTAQRDAPRAIDVDGLEPLADDESFWPIYSPCPCLSASVAEAHPEARDALDRIGPSVDGAGEIRELNAAVTIDGRSAQSVAREHLESAGVI